MRKRTTDAGGQQQPVCSLQHYLWTEEMAQDKEPEIWQEASRARTAAKAEKETDCDRGQGAKQRAAGMPEADPSGAGEWILLGSSGNRRLGELKSFGKVSVCLYEPEAGRIPPQMHGSS